MANYTKLTSNEKGKHSELLVATALLANGYSVLEPIAPEAYDYAVRRIDSKETFYVQVKSAFERDEKRYGGRYVVVRGHKNNGEVYTENEVDIFAAVWRGNVYLFPNREKSEYWVRTDQIDERWERIETEV